MTPIQSGEGDKAANVADVETTDRWHAATSLNGPIDLSVASGFPGADIAAGLSTVAGSQVPGDQTSTTGDPRSGNRLPMSKDPSLEMNAATRQSSLDPRGVGGDVDASGAATDHQSSRNGATATMSRPAGTTAAAGTSSLATPGNVSSAPGGIAIPEGMHSVESNAATAVSNSMRPSSSSSDRRAGSGQGSAAVSRAEELNASIRNERGASETGVRPASPSPITTDPSILDSSGGRMQGSPKPMQGSADAQSLPTLPASLAPEEAETGPRRTAAGVARGLQALSAQKGGTLIMRLDPQNLGQVRMQLNMEAGRVTVLITAAGETARSLLRDNLGVLRHALEDRGFAVDRLTVESSTKTSSDSSASRSDRGDGQDARSGSESSDRQDAGGERSRGRRDHAPDRPSDPEQAEAARFNEVLADSGVTSDQ
ncbi:MAG: flagellar hook-length control protein FliK [Phycisphaerales bacterium]|nr:flagellar hook-length control protein FliK [Phycisphaerales bacterium]